MTAGQAVLFRTWSIGDQQNCDVAGLHGSTGGFREDGATLSSVLYNRPSISRLFAADLSAAAAASRELNGPGVDAVAMSVD